MKRVYAFMDKSVEKLAREANEALRSLTEMSLEEEKEDDAQYGYFQDDEED